MNAHFDPTHADLESIEHLPWDTEFFGVRVARVFATDADADRMRELAERTDVACLYVFVRADRLDIIERLVRQGATLVDLRTELGAVAPHDGWKPPEGIRPARRADLPALLEAAEHLAAVSRFAEDPRFDRQQVVEMYRIWIDRCLVEGCVAVPLEKPQSFVGVRAAADGAHVDLVYVNPDDRGSRLASRLITGALAYSGAHQAAVVTQLGNVAALRVYQSLAFRTRSCDGVLHLWTT